MVVALVATMLSTSLDAMADLNLFEANTRGEFNIGSTIQFGSIDFRFICNDVWLQIYIFKVAIFSTFMFILSMLDVLMYFIMAYNEELWTSSCQLLCRHYCFDFEHPNKCKNNSIGAQYVAL